MSDMFLGSAQGAVDSLLGRLTSALADEARLLSGVRADVHFIKDEMESMNGFLLHVAEATAGSGGYGEEDHGVRAWMKQVAEVAYASQNCVDLYVRTTSGSGSGDLLAFLRQLPRLLWTVPTRHRIAVQIRELKVRSREVGERRLRYGVEAPPKSSKVSRQPSSGNDDDDGKGREREDARRRALAEAEPPPFESFSLVRWMTDDDAAEHQGMPRVIALVGGSSLVLQQQQEDGQDGDDESETRRRFAETAFMDPWVASSCSLDQDCMALVQARGACSPSQFLRDVLAQLEPPQAPAPADHQSASAIASSTGTSNNGRRRRVDDQRQLVERLRQRLQGRKFLLLAHDVSNFLLWDGIRSAFLGGGCAPGSAILITTQSLRVAYSFQPYEIYDVSNQGPERHDYLAGCYLDKAVALVANNTHHPSRDLEPVLRTILKRLASQPATCRLFIQALYVDPNKTLDDFKALRDHLLAIRDDDDDDSSSSYSSSDDSRQKQVIVFLYNGLSRSCKNCLMYLSNFPERTTFRRTRLVRRWAAEGMVTKRGKLSALEEAEHCFDMLVARRLVVPTDTDVSGRIRSCVVHDLVTEVARDAGFVGASCLPPELAHRISIRNALQIQQAAPAQQRHSSRSACWRNSIRSRFFFFGSSSGRPHSNADIVREAPDAFFLDPIPLSSTQLGLLQVVDLEDCRDFKDHQLKHICKHGFQLKYLSLRNTGITKLPKKLGKLRNLETLDIRQTKVRAFPKKSILLPKLKHLLAGVKNTAGAAGCRSLRQEEESLHTIQMPKHVGSMTELQVLSHVAVSGSGEELVDIGNLHRLRKLGLVLDGSQKPAFRHLFHAIGKLTRCLHSLSICVVVSNNENSDTPTEMEDRLLMPPRHLRHLQVSGMVNGLTDMVKDLPELTKITMHKTFLMTSDIKIIGRMTRLSYLQFRQDSFTEKTLTFSKGGFQNLKYLVIDCLDVISINFDEEATPRLEKIIWFSTGTQCLTGIEQLPSLKELHLTGNFDYESVQQAIASNINNPVLRTN